MPRDVGGLNSKDLRTIYLLVGECCELGADPLVWRQHMLQRLNAELGAVASIDIQATFDPQRPGVGARVDAAMTLDHFSAQQRQLLTQCLREMPMEANPLGVALLERCRPGDAAAAVRRELVSDAQWRRCGFWTDYFEPVGWDDMLVALAKTGDGLRLFNFSRERGERPFPRRAARVLELFARELAGISPQRLAPLSAGSLLLLPPRMRAVLAALAEGDGEKQVALRLGISRNTVHEYVRRLFARYGVASRSELLVRAARQLHALALASPTAEEGSWFFQREPA
ncbi:MAG TPA: LuxR C-terminal-related transcriptional regulator [Lacipirellulaceae bacterium]|nr:LuxR C-terminal-related transcriptional regulator [Lacipirellulaceae bacterium]